VSDWLLGTAIRFEYGDNGKFHFSSIVRTQQKIFSLFVVDKFKSVLSNTTNTNENPLETIDCKQDRPIAFPQKS